MGKDHQIMRKPVTKALLKLQYYKSSGTFSACRLVTHADKSCTVTPRHTHNGRLPDPWKITPEDYKSHDAKNIGYYSLKGHYWRLRKKGRGKAAYLRLDPQQN